MDYLTICQRVNDIVGFQGQITSVTAGGYQAVLTQAVKDAHEDIQRYRPEWDFQRATRSINVDDTKTVYTLEDLWAGETPDLANYLYINYDYRRLPQVSYDLYQLRDFKDKTDKPNIWTMDPATKDLIVNPLDGLYTLNLYYTQATQVLAKNTDIPNVPERFHQAIVYGACIKLATYTGNITLSDTYSLKYAEILAQLMREANPAKRVQKRPVA